MSYSIVISTKVRNFTSKEDIKIRLKEIDDNINHIKTEINKFVYLVESFEYMLEDSNYAKSNYFEEEIEFFLQNIQELSDEKAMLYSIINS